MAKKQSGLLAALTTARELNFVCTHDASAPEHDPNVCLQYEKKCSSSKICVKMIRFKGISLDFPAFPPFWVPWLLCASAWSFGAPEDQGRLEKYPPPEWGHNFSQPTTSPV